MENKWIAICDDQMEIAKQLQSIVQDICVENKISIQTKVFYDSRELLNSIEECSIVFLDLDMPEMDGIELGKRIIENNLDCKIIVATGRVDRYKEAFTIQALRFVTKPFDKKEIEEALLTALVKKVGNGIITAFMNRISYDINESNIVYLMAYNGYVEIVTGNGRYRKDTSLDSLECDLDKRIFVRIHKGYIVNLQWIKGFDSTSVFLINQSLPLSRRKRKVLEQKFIEFDLKYRGR